MILTLLFCMFGGIFTKSLPDINRDLTYVLEEFQKYEIETPKGFNESIHELNILCSEIFENRNLKGKTHYGYNPFEELTDLIRLFIEKYFNMYNSFEEFFEKWQKGEIEISESIGNNSTESNSTSEELQEDESFVDESSFEESNSTIEEFSKDESSIDELPEESNSTQLTYPKELLKLYEDIIEYMKLELYPALVYFKYFTEEIADVINHKTLAINYELFLNRLKFDMTPEGIEFRNANNSYFKLFKEFNNSIEEVIEDYNFQPEKLFNETNQKYILNKTLSELENVFNRKRTIKQNSKEELDRKFNDLLSKFDLLDSCVEKNETVINPPMPNTYNGSSLISTIIIAMFLLLLF